MAMTEFSKKYKEKIFQGCESELIETDPEFMERFNHFVFDEVVNQVELDNFGSSFRLSGKRSIQRITACGHGFRGYTC